MKSRWHCARSLIRPARTGSTIAFALAALMTGIDWWKNPAGIFHDRTGTDWAITRETFFSWFWPALPAMIIVMLLLYLARRHCFRPKQERP